MRVLHVLPSLYPETGGPARSVPALCHALHTVGMDVTLYTFRRPGAETTVSQDNTTFPIEWFVPLPGSRQLPTLTFWQRLRQDIRRFDLVHLHSLWNPVMSIAALTCRQSGIPYCLSPRGMLQTGALRRKYGLKMLYYGLVERHTIEGAEAMHFLTEAEAGDSQYLLHGTTPIVVIPSGVDPSMADDIQPGRFRQSYPDLQGKRIMLFLGRLHWSKGLNLQVQALALLVRNFPDLVWVLIGPDGREWEHLSRQISHMALQRHVLWTGSLPHRQCLEALADVDVFLLTSRHEAHSMAMNEALTMGVPIVITDTVRFDKIKEWGAGSIVPWDAQHLASAIATILEHPEEANKMRKAGRSLADECLAWSRIAEQMKLAYGRILSVHSQKNPAADEICGDVGNV